MLHKRTASPIRIIFSITFLLRKTASCNVVEVKISFIMIILFDVAWFRIVVNSDQIVLQLCHGDF